MKTNSILKMMMMMSVFGLGGCVATMDQLTNKINDTVSSVVSNAKTIAQPPVKHPSVAKSDVYRHFVKTEIDMVKQISDHQKRYGLQTWFYQRQIKISASGIKSYDVPLVASFRAELPGDGVLSSDLTAFSAIESMTRYVALRSTHEPSKIVIVAQTPSSGVAVQSIVDDTLKKYHPNLRIEINVEYAEYFAIGWMSLGSQNRSF